MKNRALIGLSAACMSALVATAVGCGEPAVDPYTPPAEEETAVETAVTEEPAAEEETTAEAEAEADATEETTEADEATDAEADAATDEAATETAASGDAEATEETTEDEAATADEAEEESTTGTTTSSSSASSSSTASSSTTSTSADKDEDAEEATEADADAEATDKADEKDADEADADAEAGALADGTYEASGKGIGGDVPVTVTVEGGAIESVEVGDNSETQGIGSNAIEQLPEQFVGLKTAEEVDALDGVSGATITSNALKDAVADCLEQASAGDAEATDEADADADDADEADDAKAEAGALADGTYEASGKGIGGDVPVTVTVKDGAIESVEVGDNSETQGIGSNAIEQLPEQFVGLKTAEEVDALDGVSGATITSNALKDAVADCLEQASAGDAEATDEADADADKADEKDADAGKAEAGALADGTYEGTGKGIGGDVPVTVTVKDGAIESVEVGDNSETQGIGSNAIEQLPELIVEANGTEGVDGVSGATITSNALKDAVADCLEQASAGDAEATDEADADADDADEADDAKAEAGALADGTYEASGKGIGGDVPVTVTVKDGAIESVEVGDNSETQGIGSNAIEQLPEQFVGLKTAEEVDALDGVSGATITSNALKDAVADCLEQASAGDAEATDEADADADKADEKDADAGKAEAGALADGTYEGTGKGIGGDVPVTVTVKDGAIESVEVGDNSETQGIGSNAIEQLPELIVEANGTEGVDGVSGATITSNALKDAVADCLEQASAGDAEATDEADADADDADEADDAKAEAGALADGTYEASGKGIGGDVPVTVTVKDGAIESVEVGDNSETQGIGSNAIEQLPEQFVGLKTAEEVDALDGVSGATITSNALKDAVADCLEQASAGDAEATDEADADADKADEKDADAGKAEAGALADGTYEGTGKGIGGDVPVTVTVKDGAIESVEVGDNSETQGIGSNAIEQLPEQFVGLKTAEEVDALDGVSGATITSNALKDAVADCLEQASAGDAEATDEADADADDADEADDAKAEAGALADGTYEASGKGIGGDVPVTVTVKDGAIESVEVGDNSETQGIGSNAIEQLPEQFVGLKTAEEVDALDGVSGATITSNALKDAVADCLEQASAGDAEATDEADADADKADEKDADAGKAEAGALADGTYEGTGKGIGGDVPVTVTVKDGAIESVEVGDNSETQGIGSNAIEQLPELIVEANGTEGVDGVSGATITSNAIFAAVEEALEQAQA